MTFIMRYGACVTNISLYCKINFFGRYVDDNLFKTDEKYAAGRLIRTSLFFSSELCDHFCEEI